MIFFLYIKILNINFNCITMDKNIKDYITGMYNFLYDLHIDDPGTCMTGKELLSKMVSIHNTPYQNLWYRNFISLLIHTNSPGYPYGFISPACPMSVAEKINILRDAQTILKSGQYYGLCAVLTEALRCWPKFCYQRTDLLRPVYHMMVTGGINMIQTRECRYCVN